MWKVPHQNTILRSLKISLICPVYDDRLINYMKYNWLKNSGKIGLHRASNCPVTLTLLHSLYSLYSGCADFSFRLAEAFSFGL